MAAEDDFALMEAETEEPPSKGSGSASTGTPAAKRTRRGGGGGSPDSSTKTCPIDSCFDMQKKGARLCLRHQRLYDSMRYQAAQKGEDQLEGFNTAMADTDAMCAEVEAYAAENADVPEGKKKKPVQWAEFNKRHTKKRYQDAGERKVPFEKEQWILRMMNKFGRSRQMATQQWESHESAGVAKSDYKGFQGQLRLWLSKGEFLDTGIEESIEGSLTEGTERKKNPKQQHVDALKNHVHDMFNSHGIGSTDTFFKGATLQHNAARNKKTVVEEEEEQRGSSEEEAPTAPPAKKARGVVSIVNLDDPEDDPKVLAVNGKNHKKKMNVQDAKMSLYTKMNDGLEAKRKEFQLRLEEAAKQIEVESTAPETSDKTEKLTRQLKTTAIKNLKILTEVILNETEEVPEPAVATVATPVAVKTEVVEEGTAAPSPTATVAESQQQAPAEETEAASSGAGKSDGDRAADAAAASASNDAPAEASTAEASEAVLSAALSLASKVHTIGFPHHVRRFDWMETFAEGIPSMDTEEEIETARLVWRRLEVTLSSLNTAFKAANISLKKYLEKKEADRKKAENKKKDAQDKERLSKQKADLDSRAKTLATSVAPVPNWFTLDRSDFEAIPQCMGPEQFNSRKACCFEMIEGCCVKQSMEEFLVKPIVQQVMTGFGGKYKKMDGFREEGKVASTLTVKQGKEEAECFFSKAVKTLNMQPMSLTKISAAWNTTSWLWGLRPTTFWSAGSTPNGAAYFKLVSLGEIETWVLDTDSVIEATKALGVKYTGIEALVKYLQEISTEDFKKIKDKGAIVQYRRLKREDMIFVPMGALVLEKASDASLIYGLRKSFMFDTPENKAAYATLMGLISDGGASVSKMEQVSQLFS